MSFIDDKVLEVLSKLPSECAYIDYKEFPYIKGEKDYDFILDVISMLNSDEGIGRNKFIIVGVTNEKKLKGISKETWRDDNEWQNLLKKITPRPHVSTGMVLFDGRLYGYIFIDKSNKDFVYEVKETVTNEKSGSLSNKTNSARKVKGVYIGQAFTRYGSQNSIMFNEDRKKLMNRIVYQSPDVGLFNNYNVMVNDLDSYIIASLVGLWNEEYVGDIKIIERFSQKNYSEFKKGLRTNSLVTEDIFIYVNKLCSCKNHKSSIIALAEHVMLEHVEKFFVFAKEIFADIDPKYELRQDQRFAADCYLKDKKRVYSKNILRGVAETIAILGNFTEGFKNINNNKIFREIYSFEKTVFSAKDWKIYATIADEFEYLGAAYPLIFLNELQRLLEEKDEIFLKFLNEKETSIVSMDYGQQLKWILRSLAQEETYFSSAMYVLMLLSTVRESFLDSLVEVLVPWCPQTHANVQVRIGILKGFSGEFPQLTWKVLMKLMPDRTTSVSHVRSLKFRESVPLPEVTIQKDYIEATVGYIDLALDMLNHDVQRMADLLTVVEHVPKDIQEKILIAVEKGSDLLDERDRSFLWNKIQDLIVRHIRFSDQDWSLPKERVEALKTLGEKINKQSTSNESIRLFRNNQYSLINMQDDTEKQLEELHQKQKEIIKSVYEKSGVESVIQFAAQVENKALVGRFVSNIFTEKELKRLIASSTDILNDELLRGIVWNLSFEQLKTLIKDFSETDRAKLFSILLLSDNIVETIQYFTPGAAKIFWENVSGIGNGLIKNEFITVSIKSLNQIARTELSVEILYDLLKLRKVEVSEELVIETLQDFVQQNNINQMEVYYLQYLIKWLQSKKTNKNKMLFIEWKYLSILDSYSNCKPQYLWNELSSNPVFFVDILKKFAGRGLEEISDSETKSKISMHCYDLLNHWKQMPGLQDADRVDIDLINSWIYGVKQNCEETDLFNLAMDFLGKTFFYAPKNEDGFFINIKIAELLQSDKEGSMREGYYLEAVNSRGAHFTDFSGKQEFSLEADYKEKAQLALEKGLFRFAKTLSKIAESFHNDALENIEEGKIYKSKDS